MLSCMLFTCQDKYNKTKKPHSFIPEGSSAIIEIKELNDFLSAIKNHDILSNIYIEELNSASKILQHFNPKKELYVAFINSEEQPSDYLILTENNSDLFLTDSISNLISETLVDLKIEKTKIDSTAFFHKKVNNIFAVSNKLDLIKNLNADENDKGLTKLIETTSTKSVASVIFKTDDENYSKLLFDFSEIDNKGSLYTVLDLDYNEANLKYNGIISSKDSTTSVIDFFKNTTPQRISSPKVASQNTTSLTSISFDNFSTFNKIFIYSKVIGIFKS